MQTVADLNSRLAEMDARIRADISDMRSRGGLGPGRLIDAKSMKPDTFGDKHESLEE